MKNPLIFFTAFSLLLAGCGDKGSDETAAEIAVTNSYLRCVVKDLCGDEIDILCLAPPGMCPGHFDISPSQVKQLCNCRILLLFDVQKNVENSLSRLKENGLKTGLVKTLPGLCVPETYLAACREVCNILSEEYPNREARYKHRLRAIEKRLEGLTKELQDSIKQSGASSAKVLASSHQAEFTNWLGLETVATFVGSDIETASNINHCLKKAEDQDVRFVVANKQEGTALASALADRLSAKTIVFSNFPDIDTSPDGFDQLLRNNVGALLKAATQ